MKLNVFSRTLLSSCAVVGFAQLTSAQAVAQVAGQGDADAVSVNEIVVTATRSTTTLQKTPMAIDVVTGEDLQKQNIFDAKDISKLSPGLELSNTTGRNNTATLRGIAFDPDGGTSAAVEVFFNEIPINANTAFTAIYDLGQVEVLRGPQGLFRGRTAPAGALLFGTKKASLTDLEGYAQATATTRSAYNIQGGVSVPLIQDKLAVRFSGLYDENEVAGVTDIDGRRSSSTNASGRVSVTLRPVENWTTNVMFQYLDQKQTPFILAFGPGATVGTTRTGPALTIADRKSVVEGPLNFRNKSKLLTVNSTYDFGGVEAVANVGVQRTTLTQLRDQDIGNAIPNFSRLQDLSTTFDYDQIELRLQSSGDPRFSWALSADTRNNRNYVPLHTDQHSFTSAGVVQGTCLPTLGNACYTRASVDLKIKGTGLGLSGTVGYKFTDAIKFTAGIRYQDLKTQRDQLTVINPISGGSLFGLDLCSNFGPTSSLAKIVNFYTFNPVGVDPLFTATPTGTCGLPTAPSHITSKNKLWSGGANLSWEVNPDLNVYASYGRTQRAGPPAVAVTAQVGNQYLQAKTETSDGFEIGGKAYLLDRKLSLNVALFYQKFKNFLGYEGALAAIEPSGRVTTIAIPTNGNADTKGIELQLGYRPTRNVEFGLNASYVKSKYTSPVFCNVVDANGNPVLPPAPANITSGIAQTATCTGRPLADSPNFTMTANGEVSIPIDASVLPFVRGNLSLRPGYDSVISNYHYPTDARVDLAVGLRGEDAKWEISAFVKNALNQDRLRAVSPATYRTQATNGSFIDSGYRIASINAPREFGVTGRVSF